MEREEAREVHCSLQNDRLSSSNVSGEPISPAKLMRELQKVAVKYIWLYGLLAHESVDVL